jgi:hypothetical protein
MLTVIGDSEQILSLQFEAVWRHGSNTVINNLAARWQQIDSTVDSMLALLAPQKQYAWQRDT